MFYYDPLVPEIWSEMTGSGKTWVKFKVKYNTGTIRAIDLTKTAEFLLKLVQINPMEYSCVPSDCSD